MNTEIREIGFEALPEYAQIPISFRVESEFRVDSVDSGLGGIGLTEERVEQPYVKDYDSHPEGGPERWRQRFDVSNWGIFVAVRGDRWIGGATVARDTPGLWMLAERKDLSVLWDLRVHPDFRRQGIGTRIFEHATHWARHRGCTQIKIETQNINVPACRLYAKQGCVLGGVDLFAYRAEPAISNEAMFLFYLDL